MQTKDLRNEIKASPAQLRYADTLFYGALLGFIIMLITYALYVFGVLTPQIPLDELPRRNIFRHFQQMTERLFENGEHGLLLVCAASWGVTTVFASQRVSGRRAPGRAVGTAARAAAARPQPQGCG